MSDAELILIGAHMSISKGVHNALLEGQKIGANVIQIFTANQRQWQAKAISQEELVLWEKAREQTAITHIMSHSSYLINLGSSKKELLAKSRKAFLEELKRCHSLKLDYLNFHPGASVGFDEKSCLETIVESLLSFEKAAAKGKTLLLIETTAGQGTVMGYKFEQIGYIVERVKQAIPIGVCLDTCHTFAAGYDLKDHQSLEHTLKQFDLTIGLKYLKALHLNDSVKELGSRKDRHANIGKGWIGLQGFQAIMQHKKLRSLPKYLETPLGDKYWEDEIKLLKKLGK